MIFLSIFKHAESLTLRFQLLQDFRVSIFAVISISVWSARLKHSRAFANHLLSASTGSYISIFCSAIAVSISVLYSPSAVDPLPLVSSAETVFAALRAK